MNHDAGYQGRQDPADFEEALCFSDNAAVFHDRALQCGGGTADGESRDRIRRLPLDGCQHGR